MPGEGRHGRQKDDLISRARGLPVKGELLRSLRLARSLTQRKAAERAGICDRLIRKAENGGPLEQNSIELLAQLYSTPARPLTADDLIDLPVHLGSEQAAGHQHELLMRRWFDEVWNRGRLEAIDELASPNCVLYAEGVEFHGPAAIRERAEAIRAGFRDFDVHFEHVATHRDLVIGRWRMAMTNTGVWRDMPPTKKRIVVHGSTWMRIQNGRLRERWDFWELQQVTDAVRAAQRAPRSGRKKPSRARQKRR